MKKWSGLLVIDSSLNKYLNKNKYIFYVTVFMKHKANWIWNDRRPYPEQHVTVDQLN